MAAKTAASNEILIEALSVGRIRVPIIGKSPIIMNAMSAKARRDLLLPKGRKTVADKAQTLKHDPYEEFVNSCYRSIGNDHPSRIVFPASAVKKAMMQAALEIPGAKKAQIGRIVWVCDDTIPIYGTPELFMAVVRSADMNKTPDVRSRAIIREWATEIDIEFTMPAMNETNIVRLLETAGIINGIGDFRQEKGAGNYGQFRVCEPSEIAAIKKGGGLKAQDAAFAKPVHYNSETEELYDWYLEERKARGK